jgi:hypothetical protein
VVPHTRMNHTSTEARTCSLSLSPLWDACTWGFCAGFADLAAVLLLLWVQFSTYGYMTKRCLENRFLRQADLEWLRLNEQGTFDPEWSVSRMASEFPLYQRCDIGHLFYVYDYKYSGEHRVRLVFDGSRQSATTYKETYAPTARQESVRLFHIVCVEESWGLGQYDVPQAFLKALIDHVIFAYPPKGQAAYPGQILLLKRALYGGKQSAYLWFTLINDFVLSLGFVASPLDSCLYRREDAILILFCDDLRIGASDVVLTSLYRSFYEKFDITTASGDRFLSMTLSMTALWAS